MFLAACTTAFAQTYDTNNDVVQTFAGFGIPGYIDAQGQSAEFSSPSQIISDTASNLYIWDIGTRDAGAAYHFIHDLKARLATRVQLTTDGHKAYLSAVEDAFGAEVDYAMLVKIYGNEQATGEVRYSPAVCMGARRTAISGTPDHNHVSTSICERQNLTMRMSMRRFTRLTSGYSKKLENLEHNVALYFMNYNFCRIHHTLRVTPAMEAGIANHVWDLSEVVVLIDAAEESVKLAA